MSSIESGDLALTNSMGRFGFNIPVVGRNLVLRLTYEGDLPPNYVPVLSKFSLLFL